MAAEDAPRDVSQPTTAGAPAKTRVSAAASPTEKSAPVKVVPGKLVSAKPLPGKSVPAKAVSVKTAAKRLPVKPLPVKPGLVSPSVAKPLVPKGAPKAKVKPPLVATPATSAKPVARTASAGVPAVAKPVVVTKPVSSASAQSPAALKPAPAPSSPAPTASTQAKPVSAKLVVAKPPLEVASTDKPAPPAAVAEAVKGAAITTASAVEHTFAGLFTPFMLEDTKMDMSANFSGFQDAVTEAQAKAKAAFEKGTSALGEATEFAKGNVEAVMESGKIYAEGVQSLGSELVAEGRSAFETITADIKELAAVKSPTDFFKIQGDLLRKNFDTAVAYGSKNSEAMLKLMSDAVAPISGRVSIAMEKARSVSVPASTAL